LLARLLRDGDSVVAAAAARSLGYLGNARSAEALLQALGEAPADRRPAVALACLICADQLRRQSDRERAVALCQAVRTADVSDHLTRAAAAMAGPMTTPVSLFDGRTFDGWEGNQEWFRIEDGAIVGGSLTRQIPRNEFLCPTREYANFELRLKVKLIDDKGNAGVQFRSQRIPNHHEMIGYQADVVAGNWGSLYDESRRRTFLAKPDPEDVAKVLKPGDWNEYVIRCEGKRIRLWLNGRQTVDYTEAEEGIPQTGLIGLQTHAGPPSEVWYKDLELVELP